MSTLLNIIWVTAAADIVLFNILYFCVVLSRVNDATGMVRSDAFFNFGPLKYVSEYLRLLTPQERSRWHNIYIRHWLAITSCLFVLFFILLALSLR